MEQLSFFLTSAILAKQKARDIRIFIKLIY